VAHVFEDQAKDRFTRSLAFMRKAQSLLQDDLVYRSALADAVSAIKNMLQGYLFYKVAQNPAGAQAVRWKEVAEGNRMPDLVQCCGEAGLDLRGLAVEIKQLNTERNTREHDDAALLIEPEHAERALELARLVQRRIRQSVRAVPELEPARAATVTRLASAARAAVSGQLGRGTAQPPVSASGSSREEPPPAPWTSVQDGAAVPTAAVDGAPAAEVTPVAAFEDGVAVEPSDTDELMAVTRPSRRGGRRRAGRALGRALLAATLLLAGVAAGIGIMIPVASGNAPAWLPLAALRVPTSTATGLPSLSPTPLAPVVPATAGSLLIAGATCGTSAVVLTLRNTSTRSIHWAVGSPDQDVSFASGAGGMWTPTAAGALSGGSSVLLSVRGTGGPYPVVVVATDGTAQFRTPAC
jgi:hypothetical protein